MRRHFEEAVAVSSTPASTVTSGAASTFGHFRVRLVESDSETEDEGEVPHSCLDDEPRDGGKEEEEEARQHRKPLHRGLKCQ